MNCISGDSEIYFADNTRIPIRYLWYDFQNKKRKNFIKDKDLIFFNTKKRDYGNSYIKEIYKLENAECWELTLINGKSIVTTKNHKFLTGNGHFLTLEEISYDYYTTIIATFDEKFKTIDWNYISKIESISDKDVYDIEIVNSCNNYIANGIVVSCSN